MIPWKLLDSAPTPDSDGDLCLYQRGAEFSIRIGRGEVMNSRAHASEDALAQLGCAGIADRARARVLIGGLGMGFTTAAALAVLQPDARLVAAELIPAVVSWNRGPLAQLAGNPLDDPRVEVRNADVATVLKTERAGFDAVLLDVDNSPDSMIVSRNAWLYTAPGVSSARAALRPGGALGVWSVSSDAAFTRRLRSAGFEVAEHSVRARGGRGGARHTVWVATRD